MMLKRASKLRLNVGIKAYEGVIVNKKSVNMTEKEWDVDDTTIKPCS